MDFWAIGIVIIEIIAGTDVTLPLINMDNVEEMLDILEETIDEGTYRLLKYLLMCEPVITIDHYINEDLDKNPTIIATKIMEMDKRLDRSARIGDIETKFEEAIIV